MFDKIKLGAENLVHAGKVFWGKNAPTILFVTGIVGVIGGTVLACNATLKVPDIIKDRDDKIKELKEQPSDISDETSTEIVNADIDKQVMAIHAKTAVKIGVQFAPAVIVDVISIVLMNKSRHMLVERYLAMSAAYAALQAEFSMYRKGVRERWGEEVDNELLFGVKKQTITHANEDGTETEEEVEVFDISKYTQDTANAVLIFDERSTQWENNYTYNKRYIDLCFYNANEKLNERGRERSTRGKEPMDDIFLINEIADMMDVPRTVFGAINGWKYDPNNPTKISYDIIPAGIPVGDNQVVYDTNNPRAIIIRLNIDGNVLASAASKTNK